MITISSDKGYIDIESWEDIESRPGFIKNLNPNNEELKSIIGLYSFEEKIRCGLSNCHTPHAKGYIVTTKSRRETNIGKDCGKKYFGVDFEARSRKFDRDVDASRNRETLCKFNSQTATLEIKLHELHKQHHGADWVNKNTTTLRTFGGECPAIVIKHLSEMAKSRSPLLKTQRLATNQEIEDIESIEGRAKEKPYYIEETIAEISGIEALYHENNLRDILVIGIEKELRAFKLLRIDELSFNDLTRWVKWTASIDSGINKIKTIIEYGRKLISENNLKPFIEITTDPQESIAFQNYINNI